MPKYEVEIPGSGVFEVESDRPLTDAEAYRFAMSQASQERPRPQRSRADELLRQLGLTARAGVESAVSLPSMIANVPYALADVGIGLAQKMGANVPTLAERGISATRSGQIIADILGLPKPETEMERGVQSIAQAMGGAGTAARLTEALANRAIAPSVRAMTQQGTQVAQRIAPALEVQAQLQPTVLQQTAQTLAQSPLAQVLAGGTAASATEAVKEMGGGTGAQLAAGLFGGAMIPGSAGGAQTVSRAAREIVRPGTEAGREVIAGNVLRSLASDAERAIMAAEGYQAPIAGYRPTTAQATRDIGLASAETPIRGLDQTGKFAQQQVEANRARMAILDRLAKDKDALDKAIAKRDEVSDPIRDAAFAKATVDPEAFKNTINTNVNKTIDDILASPVGKRRTVIDVMDDARQQIDMATTPQELYEIRKDLRAAAQGLLDKSARGGPTSGAYKVAKNELNQVIRSVDNAIESAAPGYRDYLQKYAASSRGIERMEAAQEFRGRVMSTIPDPSNIGEYLISQPSFTRAIRAAAEDTKLSKTQLAVLQRVSQDIDSGVLARATKVPGSDTFKNLSTANIIGGIVGKQMFGEVPPAFAKVVAPMNWLYNGSDDAIRQLLVDAMLDPQLAAKMMRKATQATVEPLSEELKKKALAGGLGTAFGLE
jgi:hypothetical protein